MLWLSVPESLTFDAFTHAVLARANADSMSIQDIAVSHNTRKRLLRAVTDESVLFQDDDGAVVVDAARYEDFKADTGSAPLEDLLGDVILDVGAQFFVFE